MIDVGVQLDVCVVCAPKNLENERFILLQICNS